MKDRMLSFFHFCMKNWRYSNDSMGVWGSMLSRQAAIAMKFLLTCGAGLCMIFWGGGCLRSPQARWTEEEDLPSYYKDSEKQEKIPSVVSEPKKKVMIFDFWNDTENREDTQGLGAYAALELKRQMEGSPSVLFPIQSQNTPSLKTEDFIEGTQVQVPALIQQGRKMGMGVFILGRIHALRFWRSGDEVGLFRQKQSQASATLEIKVFDVQSGKEALRLSRSSEVSQKSMLVFDHTDMDSPEFRRDLLRAAIHEAAILAAPEMLKSVGKMVWEGRVVALDEFDPRKIYVNAGAESGLVMGDILKVFRPGKELYDPGTGAFLGKAEGQLKATVEVRSFTSQDGAVTHLHTGGAVQVGDSVQLY